MKLSSGQGGDADRHPLENPIDLAAMFIFFAIVIPATLLVWAA